MTCNEYRTLFLEVATEFPDANFSWIDIEDHADLLDPVEVENFPTLLIFADTQVYFFGVITPHAQTLRRLIQTYQNNGNCPAPQVNADVYALAQRLA